MKWLRKGSNDFMKRKNISIILNLLIVILEIIGFICVFKYNGNIQFEYYTEDSNIIALFVSFIYAIFLLLNKKIPKWLSMLKYMMTICLTVTFLVVIFVLIPMADFNFFHYMFDGALLYQHTFCPILAIITFIFFDELSNYNLKDNIIGLSLTFLYSLILVPLNIMDIVVGPYPFLMVKNQTILASIIWFIILNSLSFIIAFGLRKFRKKALKIVNK